jgi:hypothetical protein
MWLPRRLVTRQPKRSNARTTSRGRNSGVRASDRYFNLARGHVERHAELGSDRQAFPDRIDDVRLSLGFRLPLADAAWDRGALGDIHAVLVLMDADYELQPISF